MTGTPVDLVCLQATYIEMFTSMLTLILKMLAPHVLAQPASLNVRQAGMPADHAQILTHLGLLTFVRWTHLSPQNPHSLTLVRDSLGKSRRF